VLCAIYAVVFAECFVRLLAPQTILPRYVVATPWGVRGNAPGSSYWQSSVDYRVQVRVNAQGMRADRTFPEAKPAGTRRLVVLGDSFGMGYEVDLADSFVSRLEARLTARGERWEVINLSVSGHGNAEELLTLRAAGLRYQPDAVLVCWHSTDFDDNVRSNLFHLVGGRLETAATSYLPGVRLQAFLFSLAPYRWIGENSHLYGFARETVAARIKSAMAAWQSARVDAAVAGDVAAEGSVNAGSSAVSNYAADLTVALLAELRRETEAAGARFLVLDIPQWRSRQSFVSVMPPVSGIEVVRPLDRLLRHIAEHPQARLYWDASHYHFTPEGCRLVAEELDAAMSVPAPALTPPAAPAP